jgi:hypothetical protein
MDFHVGTAFSGFETAASEFGDYHRNRQAAGIGIPTGVPACHLAPRWEDCASFDAQQPDSVSYHLHASTR